MMAVNNWIIKNVILPLSDIALGQSIKKHLDFLQKSQWWSEGDLKEYQNEKLRALIKHAYENVPYYNELFKKLKLKPDDIKNTDDLVKLPILTKEDIRENFKNGKIIAKNIPEKELILSGSSGSTGEPLQYYTTKDSYSFNIATNLRGWYWMGYRLGDKYIKLSQNPRNQLHKKIQDRINNCIYVLSQSLTPENIEDIVNNIRRSNASVVRAYPSTLFILSDYISKNNITDIELDVINATGEILFPHMRKAIEDKFHCPVFDSYSGEGGATAFECDSHDKYHLAAEYAFTEFISNGERVTNSGKGEIVSTDFWNYAVPFIRYNSKDVAVISDSKCSCKRGLPVIDKIEGRDVDILETPSGKKLIVHYFTGYFEWIDTVSQFQVVQYEADKIELKIIPNDKFNNTEKEKIFNDISSYIGSDVDFSIKVTNEIPVNPKNGKRRFVIRKHEIREE